MIHHGAKQKELFAFNWDYEPDHQTPAYWSKPCFEVTWVQQPIRCLICSHVVPRRLSFACRTIARCLARLQSLPPNLKRDGVEKKGLNWEKNHGLAVTVNVNMAQLYTLSQTSSYTGWVLGEGQNPSK